MRLPAVRRTPRRWPRSCAATALPRLQLRVRARARAVSQFLLAPYRGPLVVTRRSELPDGAPGLGALGKPQAWLKVAPKRRPSCCKATEFPNRVRNGTGPQNL